MFIPKVTIGRCVVRRSVLAMLASLALVEPALSDLDTTVKDLQSHPFVVAFPSGNKLRLHPALRRVPDCRPLLQEGRDS
jgi:hypothetical protein